MSPTDADTVSAEIRAAGYDHLRKVTADGDSIVLQPRRYAGNDLIALVSILVPNGVPIEGVTVSLEATGIVIS